MRRYIFSLLLACLVAGGAAAKSPKRGVSENAFSMGSMLEALEPGVTWYYNWGNTPGKGYGNQVIDFEGIEFVPMCWNANYNADAIREYCRSHPQTRYLLGFNEPNFTKQANMTPEAAAAAWPAVKALADELGLKLVAPALNYSPNPPYTDPLKWMDEFVALVGNDAFDYTAVHCYGGLNVMKRIAGDFHDRYGKDVWVTEFCYWPNEGNASDYVSPDTQISAMVESVQWLETTPWIYRYAWFKPIGNSDSSKGPNYGLLVHEGSGTDPWSLSRQGTIYVNMSEYPEGMVHPVGSMVAASEYSEATSICLDVTADSHEAARLDVTGLISGADITWPFAVDPAGGEYVVTLRLSGVGEPVRYDPQLQWLAVDADGIETPIGDELTLTLPGSDTDYREQQTALTLPGGTVALRLRDAAPYRPSGIRISALSLGGMAGIPTMDCATDSRFDVYSLQGAKMRCGAPTLPEALEGLPAGIYIAGGRKVVVR